MLQKLHIYICIEQRGTSNSQKSIPTGCQSMEGGCSSKSTVTAELLENIREGPLSCIGAVPDKQINHEPAEGEKTFVEKLVSCDKASFPNSDDWIAIETTRDETAS